jgi:sugar-specific transcriptional regulator TrmB
LQVSESTERASALIASRLEEIKDEAASLERALRALAPEIRPRRAKGRRVTAAQAGVNGAATRRPSSSRRSRRRAAPGQRREELLAAIKAKPGATVPDLSEAIGIPRTQVHRLIARARAERLVAKDGDGYRLKGG